MGRPRKWIVHWVSGALYVFGLTLLIPLLEFVLFPWKVFSLVFVMTVVLATLCILAAYRLLRWHYGASNRVLRRLGVTTLIPAGLAIVLSFFSTDVIFLTLGAFLPDVVVARPLVDAYVASKVPAAEIVFVIYAVTGLVFLWVSREKRR